MESITPHIWKTHKTRDYSMKSCPHCGRPLRWILSEDGDWLPCDEAPVQFILHPEGLMQVVYKRNVYPYALIYKPGDKRFTGTPLRGNVQHVITCPVLRKQRAQYVAENFGDDRPLKKILREEKATAEATARRVR